MSSGLSPTSVLKSGTIRMPVIGLGTWQSTDEEIEQALNSALEAGYRHIDTAYVYLNEAAIGKTFEKWFSSGRIRREELFIVTKLPAIANRAEEVETYIKKSLEALKLDYVDLYLVHFPVGLIWKGGELWNVEMDLKTDLVSVWKAMEKQVEAGRAKSIGVSNFTVEQIERLIKNSKIPPANNQVEMHIYFQQREMLEFCNKNNITVCAYGPLGSSARLAFTEKMGRSTEGMSRLSPLSDPVVQKIADAHKKTAAQVLLRFLIQLGVAVIPKSVNPDRIKQNLEIFDFELSTDEMEELKALDKGKDGRMFQKGVFSGLEAHPEFPF